MVATSSGRAASWSQLGNGAAVIERPDRRQPARSPSRMRAGDGVVADGLPENSWASMTSAARRYWEASQSSARCR